MPLDDTHFLGQARYVASASKDPSTRCGAVIVRPDRTVASEGYNGFPMGISDVPLLTRSREHKLNLTIHAEMNALLFSRERLLGYTLYAWPFGPCCRCAVHVIQAGIKRVVAPDGAPARWQESIQLSRELFYEADVEYCECPRAVLISELGRRSESLEQGEDQVG